MRVNSVLLGEIEVDDQHIITFAKGIPAFETEQEFVLIELEAKGPFCYLQATKHEELCLLLADPYVFFPWYEIDIPDDELQQVEIGPNAADMAIYVVLTVPEDFKLTTANLVAPIVVNQRGRKAMQFISINNKYTTRHLIFPPLEPQENSKPVAVGGGR